MSSSSYAHVSPTEMSNGVGWANNAPLQEHRLDEPTDASGSNLIGSNSSGQSSEQEPSKHKSDIHTLMSHAHTTQRDEEIVRCGSISRRSEIVIGLGRFLTPLLLLLQLILSRVATIFHLLFKLAALLVYLFCSMFVDNFVLVFIICVLLLAFDFWTVKNVTGRLLVGLRWWNEVKEDGTNVWIFESKPDNRQVHPTDSYIFWGSLYLTPIIWLVFGILSLTSPKWLLIVIVALILSGANVIGYWKCKRDAGKIAKQKIQSFVAQSVLSAAIPGSSGPTISV